MEGSKHSNPPMSSSTRTIIVFGDLVFNFHKDLQHLLHIKNNANLVDFFSRTSLAFRQEFTSLSHVEQDLLPRFTNLVDLLDNTESAKAAPAVRFALLCLYQIGRFILHFGKDTAVYPRPDQTYLLGLCTGSFSAAAISTCQSIVELVPAGVEAVICAFRTGLQSFRLQQDFERSSGTWSAAVSLGEEEAVDVIAKFATTKGIPRRHHPFVSAVSPGRVTISGSPSTLRDFLSFTTAKSHALNIESPFHAHHLFSSDDVEIALSLPVPDHLQSYKLRIPIISSVSGQLITEGSFEELLRQAISDTLREQVRWDKIGPASVDLITQDSCKSCTILPCASHATTFLSTSLSTISGKGISTGDALNNPLETPEPGLPTGQFSDSKIAIVGYSGRFPDAASNDEFWEILKAGKDTHRTIPEDRFDWEAHFDPSGETKNTSRVKYGCFINEPGVFDAKFFRLSPREAEDTDPAQRLALMTTYEALEMAGFVPDRTPSSQRDRVGVFYGTTSDDWREVNSGQNVGTYFIPGGNRAFVPGRITFHFRFSGPSISVDTACSSSFAALHTACQSLWQGGCDTAIAGGTNILTNPDNFAGLDKGHFLSTTGNCNPFDDDASGYCRADAVASVVLKRLEDAEADNDPIFGVIGGVNTNHCGQTVSITRPHEGDQLSLFKRILRQTNTNPVDVSYVEMHGTGTQAGDAAEMNSVLAAMVPGLERMPNHPIYLGGVKANVGHSESASGVSALIKVLMMMKHDEIPPHIGIKNRINRNYPLDLAKRNVNIALRSTPWRRSQCPGGKRISFLNNFSAAGGNTAVLLQDPPNQQEQKVDTNPRPLHPVVVSANSTQSLRANVKALLQYLEQNPGISLSALSYTTTARRSHYKFRISCVAGEISSVISSFQQCLSGDEAVLAIPPPTNMSRVSMAFTGQGVVYAGIAKQLFETVRSFKDDIVHFDRIAKQHGFPSFLSSIMSDSKELVGDAEKTITDHLTLVCVQMGLCRLWFSWGIRPDLVIGHSLGEYPALYAAGVLSASDTIYLVGTRAELLTHSCIKGSHSMLSVKAPLSAFEQAVEASSCDVACVNSPVNTVISGPKTEIYEMAENLRTRGLESVHLDIPYAFHSTQVDSWIQKFENIASKISYQPSNVPYLSPLLSGVVSANEPGILNGSYLARACRGTVNFVGALEAAKDSGLVDHKTHWLEIGSHPVCSTFINRTIGSKSITIPSLRQAKSAWETIVPAVQTLYLGGFDINWDEYHRDFPSAHWVVPLPMYKWDLKNYWIQYRGNFCLTKGDQPVVTAKVVESQPAPYISSSIHRILEEHHAGDNSTLLTESDIRDPRLLPILQGHKVNGAALCPSSLYADMALTAVRYMLLVNNMPADDITLNCASMKVDRPFIADPNGASQMLRLSATADWSRDIVSISLFSMNVKLAKVDHAKCTVKITQAPASLLLQEWKRVGHLVRGRISSLKNGVENGQSHKLKRGLAYKLFSSLVEYSNEYQGMQEVVFDTGEFEATAQVVFQTGENLFDWNPCWIDSLGHIAGFIMNGNDNMHSKDFVFVNHGWSGMRCGKKIQHHKIYQTYNKMHPEDDKEDMYVGDTYILEDGIVIAVFEGVKFQRVPRSVLDHLLPAKSRAETTVPQYVRTHKVTNPQRTKPAPPKHHRTPSEVGTRPASGTSTPPLTDSRDEVDLTDASSISSGEPDTMDIVRTTIADEVGVPLKELTLATDLAELGVDSLLSLNILDRLNKLGISLDAGMLASSQTIQDIATHLGLSEHETERRVSEPEPISLTDGPPFATSVPLQGSTSPDRKILFLFPDGAGSATSYLTLPSIAPDVMVYGLNCPWLRTPQDLVCSLEDYVAKFVVEIRRRQPSGPYYFGGWSAGGILAYEAAQQFARQGERTEKLILLDSPDPVGIQSPPERMYDFLESLDLFGMKGREAPTWLRPHFAAFITMLDQYKPVPFMKGSTPETHIIYARDGLCKNPGDPRPVERPDDPREMRWLLNNRVDFGGGGWRELVGPRDLHVSVIDDCNHYTMLSSAADKLAVSIADCLALR